MKNKTLMMLAGILVSSHSFADNTPASNHLNNDLINVHNRCIVRLNDNVQFSRVPELASQFAEQGQASIKHIYRNSIKGFTINMPCHAANAVFGSNRLIMSMEPDSVVSINKGKPTRPAPSPQGQQTSYGSERVGGVVDGTNYTAWIIDTGIDLDHPDLNVDASQGFSVIRAGGMDDKNGHGTHVAGIIGALDNNQGSVGVAQNATVIPVRVLDKRGSGTISGVIAGVDYVAANANAGDCVNMSLGGGVSQMLDNAVISASDASGSFFAIAAGNSGSDANNYSPARADGANLFTISAIDANDNMPSWSNWGSSVNYAAPGVNIFSLWKNGETNTISGTSMAAPHACAVLMLTNGIPNIDGYAGNDSDDNADPIIHL